jgi:predicted nucleotide-binding protein
MARKQPPRSEAISPKLNLSSAEIERGIARLAERIKELEAFDPNTAVSGSTPELKALEVAVNDTLLRCFGENTTAFNTYKSAAGLTWFPMVIMGGAPRPNCTVPVSKNIQNSIALLTQAQRSLKEDLEDLSHSHPQTRSDSNQESLSAPSRRVFVVHGHDEAAREMVARFLEKIGFEAIILHEQANKGQTVIEKIERFSDVSFAVVLLTPDDEGCAKGGVPEPRARQNVLLELGYFIGKLGRENVCALKRGKVEIPSDFAGIVWQPMEDSGWKLALGRELQEAGHNLDWNQIMKA